MHFGGGWAGGVSCDQLLLDEAGNGGRSASNVGVGAGAIGDALGVSAAITPSCSATGTADASGTSLGVSRAIDLELGVPAHDAMPNASDTRMMPHCEKVRTLTE